MWRRAQNRCYFEIYIVASNLHTRSNIIVETPVVAVVSSNTILLHTVSLSWREPTKSFGIEYEHIQRFILHT